MCAFHIVVQIVQVKYGVNSKHLYPDPPKGEHLRFLLHWRFDHPIITHNVPHVYM